MASDRAGKYAVQVSAELPEIISELEDFGPEGFYSVSLDKLKREFPYFTEKVLINKFIGGLGLDVDDRGIKYSDEELNDLWQNQELVLPEDWPAIIKMAKDYAAGKQVGGVETYLQNTADDPANNMVGKRLPDEEEPLMECGNCADGDCCDDMVICSWCGEEVPVSDCVVDRKLGHVCNYCKQAIESHGEPLELMTESDCRVVPCEVQEVVSHSEDEKPLVEANNIEAQIDAYIDRCVESAEPDLDENVNINVSADRPDELVSLARAILGDDFDVFDQDFDEPVENVPPIEMDADFGVKLDKPVNHDDYVDPFEKNPFDDKEEEIPDAEEEEPEEEVEIVATEEEPEEEEIPDAEEEVEETEDDKQAEKIANQKPADEQPMDMIDGKLVPAKDPKESEVEIDDEEVDECFDSAKFELDEGCEDGECDDMSEDEFLEACGKMMKNRHDKLTENAAHVLDFEGIPAELEYDDLEVPVYAPDMQGNYAHGIANKYRLSLEDIDSYYDECVKAACQVLRVEPEELTQEMIDSIIEGDDFYDALKDVCYNFAREMLEDDYDVNTVEWED